MYFNFFFLWRKKFDKTGSLSRPLLNFAPPCTYLTQIERQHTERRIDGILMGNGFLITSQINRSAVYSVALFVFWSFTVGSCSSTSTPLARVFLFPFPPRPRWGKKPNVQRSPFLLCLQASLDTRCYAAYQLLNPKPPKSNIFPILTLKSLSWSKWSQCLNRASVRILLRTVKEPCFPSVQARFIFLHS